MLKYLTISFFGSDKKIIIIPLEFLFMIMKPIKMEILNEKIAQNI